MYRHKKQSGGAGSSAGCICASSRRAAARDSEFVDAVKAASSRRLHGRRQVEHPPGLEGGVVPAIRSRTSRSPSDDSKTRRRRQEVAFTIAGRKAVIEAIRNAKPDRPRPIVEHRNRRPGTAIGGLTGDTAGRRGYHNRTDGRMAAVAAISGEVPSPSSTTVAAQVADRRLWAYTIEARPYSVKIPQRAQQTDGEQVSATTSQRIGNGSIVRRTRPFRHRNHLFITADEERLQRCGGKAAAMLRTVPVRKAESRSIIR